MTKKTMIFILLFWVLCAPTPVFSQEVAHWRLDGNGNEYINGLHAGTVGTVTYSSAHSCDGYRGDSGGILSVPDTPLLDLPDEFTVSAWVNPSSLNIAGHDSLYSIFSKDTNFEVHIREDGSVFWWWSGGSLSTAAGTVSVGSWSYISVVHSRSGGYQRIYINGVLEASHNGTDSMPVNNDAFLIGGDITTGGDEIVSRRFYGMIDEVRVDNAALSVARLEELMNMTRSCVSPLAEYRFEGCNWTTGAVVQDEQGNYPGIVVQGAHTAPGNDYNGGLCNVADLHNEGSDYNRHISLTANPIPLSGDWTLMMWINFPPSFYRHFQYSGYRYTVIAGGDHDLCWLRESSSTGDREWGASSNPSLHRAAFPSSLTGWHHLAFVGNGTNTDLYVDGTYYNSVDYKQTGTYTRIGTTADSVSDSARQNLDTQLDELKFYTGALSSGDILSLYIMEKAGFLWDGSPLNCQSCGINVDHYRIEHSGVGLTCQRSEVILRACADATCDTEYPDPVTITMTPATANPPVWISGDSYSFTGHETVQLRQTVAGVVTLGLSDPNPVPAHGYRCFNSGVEGDCDLDFFDSGFIFDVPDFTSCQGVPQITLQAVQIDDTTQACVAAAGFANNTKTVNFWGSYLSPGSGTEPLVFSGTTLLSASPGTGISLDFDANATAGFALNYSDAGQLQLNARYDGVGSEEEGLVMTGADSFVVRPVGLCVYSDESGSECLAGNGSCSAFKKVDENFNLKVKGVCWESSGDADLCSGNPTTPNFQLDSIQISHNLLAPTGTGVSSGDIGIKTVDISPADSGEAVISNQTVSEVGVYNFVATPPDYFGEALPVATSANIGRFIPDHFTTSIVNNGVFANGCSGFTYSGQPFTYSSPDFPEMQITATGSGGNTVVNYRDDFVKLTQPTQINMPAVSADTSQIGVDGNLLTLTWSPAISTLTANGDGTLNFILGADEFSYTRDTNALVAPFTSNVELVVTAITDSDGVAATGMPVSFAPTGTTIRYGRMLLQNSYGPETLPLTVPVLTEYYNGAAFVPNVFDSCTPYDSLYLTLANYQGNLDAGETLASGSGVLLSGSGGSLILSAPGTGNDGSADVMLDLSLTTGAGLEWLLPDGNNPSAKATFGIFKGNPHLIYMRESVW